MKKTRTWPLVRRKFGWALLLALAAVAMAGCFRVELAFLLNDDGSGVVQYTFAISEEVVGLIDIEEEITVEEEALPPGAQSREYTEDGYTGFVVTMPFTDYAEFRPVLDQWHREEEIGVDVPDIGQDEHGDWRFTMFLPPPLESDVPEELRIPEEVLAEAWLRVRATLPGDLVDHNADRIVGGEMVWEMGIESTQARALTARSIVSGGDGSAVAVISAIAGTAALIAGAVAIVFFVRGRAAG